MAIITKDSKLSDIVINEPSAITVLNRFNIFLGLGVKTIEDICRENNNIHKNNTSKWTKTNRGRSKKRRNKLRKSYGIL